MRRRKIRTTREFSKKVIVYELVFNSACMVACLVLKASGHDTATEFCALCGITGGEILTYSVKAYFGKKNEEENKLKSSTDLFLIDESKGENL